MYRPRRDFFVSPEFHLGMSVVWGLLVIPTLLFWPNSVLWVLVISIYANIASHLSAYQAARVEKTAGTVYRNEEEN